MNKKNYFAPSIQEVRLAMTAKICNGSPDGGSKSVERIESGNVFNSGIGKGTGQPNSGSVARSNDRGNDAEWGNLW